MRLAPLRQLRSCRCRLPGNMPRGLSRRSATKPIPNFRHNQLFTVTGTGASRATSLDASLMPTTMARMEIRCGRVPNTGHRI
jgi:hypothetical protein